MCGMVHLDNNKVAGHDIDIPWKILCQGDLLLCYLNVDKCKSGQFGHIWARFFGLRGAPMSSNVWFGPPRHQQGSPTRYRHSLGDLRLGLPLTMLFEREPRQIWLVWAYLGSFFGPDDGPHGHKFVVRSTWTLTRKVNMIQTFHGRFEAYLSLS